MIKNILLPFLGAIMMMPTSLLAAEQSVVLKVEGMTCQSCPYQVKSALKKVEGVISASASLEDKEALVTFDDAITNIAALTEATGNAGFPSALKP
tara:strand:+ start:297 stop:581 length:285 start_codon:yes stop_codon:yes gene_type:complete